MKKNDKKEKIEASDLGKALLVFIDVFDEQKIKLHKDTIERI